ncbi:MAG: response regulator [Elusimicrobia bacterium]|nr:response regulator [Elusimicrobiota bacterium]
MGDAAQSPRVLVVDDEIGFRELCADLLGEVGCMADSASNGQDALLMLEKEHYQAVLSDINMPIMDGISLLRLAKAKHPHMEIILMTAYGGLQTALDALRLGAYDYITKPFTRDVLLATMRRCLEKQRLAQELRSAQSELIHKEKLAALGSMAAWLAHRMRNPLNVILMCSQYLKTKLADSDENRQVAMAIEDKVQVLEKMTRDFIEFSRTYQPRLRPENLHSVLDGVLEAFESQSKIQNVALEKDFVSELPLVPLDRDLMEEVFANLIDNALEAMGGPGSMSVHTRRVPEGVKIDFSNTGSTIPEELKDRLFEPFFTTKERGTGLGLAIARRVVESHGGKISLITEPVTTFRIELPIPGPS